MIQVVVRRGALQKETFPLPVTDPMMLLMTMTTSGGWREGRDVGCRPLCVSGCQRSNTSLPTITLCR